MAINLFKSFILSTILLVALACAWYFASHSKNSYNYSRVASSFSTGALYLNSILLVMASPSLFLANKTFWQNRPFRLFLYFGGPLLFLVQVLFRQLARADTLFYLSAGIIFLSFHGLCYARRLKGSSNPLRNNDEAR